MYYRGRCERLQCWSHHDAMRSEIFSKCDTDCITCCVKRGSCLCCMHTCTHIVLSFLFFLFSTFCAALYCVSLFGPSVLGRVAKMSLHNTYHPLSSKSTYFGLCILHQHSVFREGSIQCHLVRPDATLQAACFISPVSLFDPSLTLGHDTYCTDDGE